MKIYCSHANAFPFREMLYTPIRTREELQVHHWVLPHEEHEDPADFNTKSIIPTCDLLIAEVSLPSTGVGIELGRAEMSGCPIIALYEKGSKLSQSATMVATEVIEYSSKDMIGETLEAIIRKYS